ncbi:uncharacterized protein FYW61_005915 [Anableps anableps]
MTKGIAGIGKTFAVQNFSLSWAEGKSNQHIGFIFVLPFRELNMLKDGEHNLQQLLLYFYPELKPLKDIKPLINENVLFILDGLDESRFLLDFEETMNISDINQKTTVDVLLINLIRGNLLPDALLWITSRPSAVSQIPSKYIDQVTEVQGFTDKEKHNYFRKRLSSVQKADKLLSGVTGMISFHLMGHIPVFCWIIAEVFRKGWSDQRITTMTELYIHYVLIQTQRTTRKYETKSSKKKSKKETSKPQNAGLLLNLSKLAFEQLYKGNIIFYEEDLTECDIDVDEASLFCGLCSEILKQEFGLYQKKMFSFVHLSFQEFLAAVYVFHCCKTKNHGPLRSFLGVHPPDLSFLELQKKVVDKALQNEKDACDLTFDINTANEHLILSECGRAVRLVQEKQTYPDHPDRFEYSGQVLCREALTGRHYWEVEWTSVINMGVAFKEVKRKGWDSQMDWSDKTWMLKNDSSRGFSFCHGHQQVFVQVPYIDVQAFLARPRRIGLFLDWPAGILCFYWLSGDTRTLLHTFHSTFTEPVYPAFAVLAGSLTLSTVEKLETDHVPLGFTPEVSRERIGVSYSFQFPGLGLFQCSLTGLVFRVTQEGEVTYRTQIWDEMLLQLADKLPGGPLFNIECPQDCISELQLPHCQPEAALVSDCLSVGHITDDGMSVIQPLRITETHVVVSLSHLSGFGVVLDRIKRFKEYLTKPIRGQVLLFLRHLQRPLSILSVILLPSNVPLPDVKEQHTDSTFIQAPSFCSFYKGKTYSLHSDPAGFTIQPKTAQFFENYGPNYHATFEITLPTRTKDMTVMVQSPEEENVWNYVLHLPVPASPAPADQRRPRLGKSLSAVEKLESIRRDFIDHVSNPVLDKLLDELQHCRVVRDCEADDVRTKPRSEKARELIDTVRRKGAEASSRMISAFCSSDQYLSSELGLM